MTIKPRSATADDLPAMGASPEPCLCRCLLALALIVAILVYASSASAHIKNEETQFPDIDFSKSRFDIVLLAAAGIIPETPVFEPDRPLQRKDLATWLALGKGNAEGGENPDIDVLAKGAVKAGLIDSLEGTATFGDIDKLFFKGATTSNQPAATPTKAEAASYLARNLGVSIDGASVLQRRGLSEGPTGAITHLKSNTTEDGDTVYVVTIGETAHPLYAHGRVAHGPTDLLAWESRTINRSLVRAIDGREMWTYLEANPIATVAAAQEQPRKVESPQSGSGYLLYGLAAAVIVLAAGLFFRGRRAS